jgi:lipopolysaccharide export LptBFGC system permease protein LptF
MPGVRLLFLWEVIGMNDEMQSLKDRMANLPSEELLQIVRIDFADYRKEALDLAKQELFGRGYSESEMAQVKGSSKVANNQMSDLSLILFAVATGLLTLFLFPVISYTSVIFYGLPAAIFILIGYGLWLIFLRTNPSRALAFAIGFVPPVAFCLLMLLAMKPLYVGMILLPFLCALLVTKFVGGFRKGLR